MQLRQSPRGVPLGLRPSRQTGTLHLARIPSTVPFRFPAAVLGQQFLYALCLLSREKKKMRDEVEGKRSHVFFSRGLRATILLLPLTDSVPGQWDAKTAE